MFNLLNDGGVLNYIRYLFPFETIYFQQDNCRVHLVPEIINSLNLLNFEVLNGWPPYSPDLNPIETVWAILKKKVATEIGDSGINIRNENQLFDLAKKCFKEIDQETINSLILEYE